MPSGKQILLEVLRELSQKQVSDAELEAASERVRAGLLLHGSTGQDAWDAANGITWASSADGKKQGLALKTPNLFLSDLFETMIKPDEVPAHVAAEYPDLTLQQYHRATWFMWLVLSSVQWFESLSSVEGDESGGAESEKLISSYIKKLNLFRDNPEGS